MSAKYKQKSVIIINMIPQIIQPMNNLDIKYENHDFLNLMKSERCIENSCQQSGCRLSSIKNLQCYLNEKLEKLEIERIYYKSHFQRQCFNCSSSFHGSIYEDGYLNLQKMIDVEEKCVNCQTKYTAERSFYHNCNICNAAFKNCTLLANHRKKEHQSEKPFQCVVCGVGVGGVLSKHIRKHKQPHVCPFCNKIYAEKRNLKIHILRVCKPNNYDKEFKWHNCSLCEKRFTSVGEFARHEYLRICTDNPRRDFKCNLCPKTFTTKKVLVNHTLTHTGEKRFRCKYCPKQFTTKGYLDIHLFEHTGNKEFKCNLCDKTFCKLRFLKRHESVHMEKSFQCKHCPKKFKNKRYLDFHQFAHTGNKRFKCDLCDKTYGSLFGLNQHKPSHMGKPFHCKYCPNQYNRKNTLNLHLLEHTIGKPYKCDMCDKAFVKQFLLNQHKSVHMEKPIPEQPFKCKYCFKEYKGERTLNVHMLEHVADKKFKCDSCDKSFAKQYLLNQHKSVHKENTFQCKICLKFFKTNNVVKCHIRRVHKNVCT